MPRQKNLPPLRHIRKEERRAELRNAIRRNNLQRMLAVLDAAPFLLTRRLQGEYTLLLWLAERNKVALIQSLFERYPDCDFAYRQALTFQELTLLHVIVKTGSIPLLQCITARFDLREMVEQPLHKKGYQFLRTRTRPPVNYIDPKAHPAFLQAYKAVFDSNPTPPVVAPTELPPAGSIQDIRSRLKCLPSEKDLARRERIRNELRLHLARWVLGANRNVRF